MSRASFRQSLTGRLLSFRYALEGIYSAIDAEPNFKIHILLGLIAVALGIFCGISRLQWLVLILVITLVISLELVNTAVEAVVDHFTLETDPHAKLAKDAAAGAVLIAAAGAVVIGIILFFPFLRF